jgi:vitamin B12 transporter
MVHCRDRICFIVFCSFLYSTISTYGQDSSGGIAPRQLEEVTVTATFIPTEVSMAGRNVISIPGEKFEKLPVNSVDELLRYVPGLEVQARGPMGAQSDFVLRGGTFQQVLVLIDFTRVNDPNTGHFSCYIPITPAQIDHIEVLKGSSSAIYGSDAVGGVVHIITKAFAQRSKDKSVLQGQITGGQYGLFNIGAGGSASLKSTHIDAGVLSNNSSGQPLRGTNGFFHNTTASAGIRLDLGTKWSVGARSSYDSRRFSAQNFYTTFASDTAVEKVTTSWNQVRLTRQGTKDKFMINGGYKQVRDNYQYNPVSAANESKSTLVQVLATYEYAFNNKSTLVSGGQWQNKGISSNDRGDHRVNQGALFAILRQTIGEQLTVNPALRLDYDERSGTEVIPQISISYALQDLQIRASAGKTIRQADFTERYNNYNKTFVASGRIGNPDLVAERSFSYEAGADYWLRSKSGGSLRISGTLFQMQFARLIDYVTTPYEEMPRQDNLSPTGTYALARNISDVITSGAELDASWQQPIGKDTRWLSTIGLIILDSKTPDGTTPSLYLSNHAKTLINFTTGVQAPRYSISFTGLYKTRTPQEATAINATLSSEYVVVNLKAEYSMFVQKLGVFVQCDNLFGEQYSDLLGAVMPGRWVMGGVRFRY